MRSSDRLAHASTLSAGDVGGVSAFERAASISGSAVVGAPGRIPGFDVLRLTALAAIVWFHTGAPGAEYMAWRLPALAIISAALAASRDRRPLACQARRSSERMLAPWLFWCGVYGVVELASHLRFGSSILDDLGPRVFLTGTSVHLWYLPFAFAMMLFVNVARRLTDAMRPLHATALALSAATTLLAVLAIDPSYRDDAGTPGPQWMRSLPAMFLGLAVAAALRDAGTRRLGLLLTLTVANSASCALLAILFEDDLAARYGLAMLLVGPAATWRFDPPRWLTSAAGLGMGVYLVHMSIHRTVYAVFNRLPTPDLPPVPHAVTVIVLSFAAAWLLAQTPLKRFI